MLIHYNEKDRNWQVQKILLIIMGVQDDLFLFPGSRKASQERLL